MTIVDLVRFGSRREDNLGPLQAKFQPLRHFYDPVNDSALDIGGYYGTTISVRSSDWALEDIETYAGDPGPRAYQDFSLRDAREYFYRALTDRSLLVRSANFGSMFQALGHVIHHLQDMAQPQHVRNDVHCDEDACRALTSALGINQLFAPSMYEKYTDLGNANNPYESVRLNLPYLGAGSTPAFPAASTGASPFRTARSLWRTTAVGGDIASGKGIAEYTNRNFFSAGTIQTYPSPPPPGLSFTTYHSPSSEVEVSALLGSAAFAGKVRFWKSEVTDSLTGVTETNERALSEGLLDSDLVKRYSTTAAGLSRLRPQPLHVRRRTQVSDPACGRLLRRTHQFLLPRAARDQPARRRRLRHRRSHGRESTRRRRLRQDQAQGQERHTWRR